MSGLTRLIALRACCLLAVIALRCAGAEPAPLWGRLTEGRYAAGYRVFFEIDRGRLDFGSSASFRPILMSVWYPAVRTEREGFAYDRYFSLPSLESNAGFPPRLAEFGRAAIATIVTGKGDGDVNELLDTRTGARENADAAGGRFPLIVYHAGSGGSFEENSVLFEFLASHGYVVVSSAYQWSTKEVANNLGGFERSVADMRCLINAVSALPFVDTSRTAAIGHSAGAQFLLQWIGMPDHPLRAIVSLDTTLEYTPERLDGHLQFRQLLLKIWPPKIPVLLVASAEKNPNFRTFDRYLRQSDRYEATVRGLRHDDYLTHGLMRSFVRGGSLSGSDRESLRRGYEAVCSTVLSFLDCVFGSRECGGPPTREEVIRVRHVSAK